MLCAIPSPCGAEELIKKYIVKKTGCEWYEDGIGNLILHFGSGSKKLMVYAPVDEDSVVVMSKEKNTVHFSHLGKTKLYPGMIVNFAGYKGVICSDDKNPGEGQYIKMLTENNVDVGTSGVLDGEFYEEDDVIFAKHAAEKSAVSAMLECAGTDTLYDVYFVFGVQGSNGHKGAIAASGSINPDIALAFENTEKKDGNAIALKLLTSAYVCNENMKNKIAEIFEDEKLDLRFTVDAEEKSCGDLLRCANSAVIGLPAEFCNAPCQAVDKELPGDVTKIIKKLLTKENLI
jgi:putative aminopeptidase FrvX